MFQKILVPVDFSPYSTAALHCAAGIAERFFSSLVVLHVIAKEVESGATQRRHGPRAMGLFGPLAEPVLAPMESHETVAIDLREQARATLQHFVSSHLPENPLDLRVEVGHPFEQILDVAQRDKVDLIVMGTHGRTGLGHMVTGSVAERIVRLARCPVLTVKAVSFGETRWA